ncbi:OLC1v1014446C2 [Oldenlandia corymbosa var. corymbosa]|uniref:OLC1v1014446C2 n=1 Tax=Oldenlandia corymbosa var. corymbosa TaxID=529605 RepID=A0AAV1E2W0_OLDCO|nr:OLC1v1014446C2 [Oldenlandia corymbosa var. corymbosa]
MVQRVFTWRYGGQRVYLYGSFNGWTERIQMIKVEGSGAIFQRILELPPGCYMYRFLVDDVWQVDKEQQCFQDTYGMINNMIFVDISEPGTSSVSMAQKPNLQLSPTDIDVLRHHLSVFLSSSTAYDLMPNSVKVIALDVDVSVRQAFHFMYEEGIAVVPLWDEESTRITGILTSSDFISILLHLHSNPASLTDEEIEKHTISAWKDLKFRLHADMIGSPHRNNRRALIQAGPDETLKEIAVKILHNKISVVPVLDITQDGSCPQLLSIMCLSRILKHLCRQLRRHLDYLPLLQQPVGYLLLGTWAKGFGNSSSRVLLTLRATEPLSSALNLLIQANVSSIPIVDKLGVLVDVYCRSDIMALANSSVYAHIQLDDVKISQVLEIVNVTGQNRFQTCTRFDSLFRVMKLFSNPGVRRLIVIDATSRQVEGIITLTDIFGYIIG